MKIAFLSNGLFPYTIGGMQKHTIKLVRHLPAHGCTVDLFFLKTPAYPDARQIEEELFADLPERTCAAIKLIPVDCPTVPYFPGHHYPESFWRSRALHRAVDQSRARYEFIYAQGYMGWSLISTRRADSRRPPIGVNFHGLEALQDSQDLLTTVKNCFAPIWLKWNLRHADCVLSLGGTLDDLVHRVGVPYDLILPSPNGIAAEWFESESGGENSTKCRFLFVGRDTDRKGFRELNRVLPSFLAAHNCEIHFAGDIDPARQISHPSVVYHGMIRSEDQLRRLYQLSDVLLCPSHSEGMPTVILEAAASGVPAIATDVGAVRLMVNEETGWLIPARNCAALEIAMQQAFRSDLAAKADAARQKAASFRWDAVARTTAGAISRFLQRRQTQVA